MAKVISEFGTIVGGSGSDIQISTMPDYTTVSVGTIVQYIGTTDANYTNGYFYKRGESGWEAVSVQAGDTGKADKAIPITANNLAALDATGNLVDSEKAASDFAQVSSNQLTAKTLANATSVATLADKQVRNIYAGTADMTAGTSALPTGDIYICYE